MKIIDIALDFIFPPTCGICGKLHEGYICKTCYEQIQKYLYKNNSGNIFYLLQYKDVIRDKMIDFKFNDKSYLYNMFCEIFVKNKNACEFLKSYDIIIPVPIHKKRKKSRGYNQSELIARKISNDFNIPIYTDVLMKHKNNKMQSSLNKNDRIKNIQDVYKVENTDKIKEKNVLIIDDIYTTGLTTKECKKVLKQAGAKQIGIMIIAKD